MLLLKLFQVSLDPVLKFISVFLDSRSTACHTGRILSVHIKWYFFKVLFCCLSLFLVAFLYDPSLCFSSLRGSLLGQAFAAERPDPPALQDHLLLSCH